MSNILISYISTIGRKEYKEYSVAGTNEKIYGMLTNEAGTKYIMKYLNDNNQKLDKMICLCSNAVMDNTEEILLNNVTYNLTAIEYLEKIITEKAKTELGYYHPVFEFVKIRVSDFESKLSEIMNKVNTEDRVFIDTTGGFRDAVIYIQLIMNILKYRNVNICKMVYTELGTREIRDLSNINRYYSILDGVNQFATSGKADILKNEFRNHNCDEMRNVINNMGRFAEALQLCDTSELDSILDDLNAAIFNMKTVKNDDGIVSVFQNMLPAIENKFIRANDSYCSIIKWCLENGLIQQALTLYIEKIPEYLIRNRILTYKDNNYSEDDLKGSINIKNPEAVIFYEKFMNIDIIKTKNTVHHTEKSQKVCDLITDRSYPGIIEFENYNIKIFLSAVSQISGEWNGVEKNPDIYNKNFTDWVNRRLSKLKKTDTSSLIYKLLNFAFSNHFDSFDEMKRIITDCIDCSQYIHKFKNISDEQPAPRIQSEEKTAPLLKPDTFEKKLMIAEKLTNEHIAGSDFKISISVDDIRNIMYDYIYAKAVRNQINHASDEENLTEAHKVRLKGYFSTENESKVEEITRNIRSAVEFIEKIKLTG